LPIRPFSVQGLEGGDEEDGWKDYNSILHYILKCSWKGNKVTIYIFSRHWLVDYLEAKPNATAVTLMRIRISAYFLQKIIPVCMGTSFSAASHKPCIESGTV
jgi:hypothetical protein